MIVIIVCYGNNAEYRRGSRGEQGAGVSLLQCTYAFIYFLLNSVVVVIVIVIVVVVVVVVSFN